MVTRDAMIYGCQVKILPHGTFYHSTYIHSWGVCTLRYGSYGTVVGRCAATLHTYYVKAIVKFTADDS